MDQCKTLLLHFMLDNLKNNNKNTRIIDLITYPVPHGFFVLIYMRLQHVKLTTREDVFIFHISGQADIWIVIGSRNQDLKAPHCLKLIKHADIGGRHNVCLPGWDANVCRGCLVGGGDTSGAWDYLAVWLTIRSLILPIVKPYRKYINPKGCW